MTEWLLRIDSGLCYGSGQLSDRKQTMMKTRSITMFSLSAVALLLGVPEHGWGAEGAATPPDMTGSAVGYFALGIFVLAYALVMAEEFTHLRKSKPVILAAGIIWALVAWSYPGDDPHAVEQALRHNILEYAELMLFLLAAMTYINAMEERLVSRKPAVVAGAQGIHLSPTVLAHGHPGVLHFAGGGQPDDGPADVRRGAGGRERTISGSSAWRVSISWWRPTRAGPSVPSVTSRR